MLHIGSNFLNAVYGPYEVILEFAANVSSVTSTEIIATLADGTHYVSLTDLAMFQSRKNVIVRDNRGPHFSYPWRHLTVFNFISVIM